MPTSSASAPSASRIVDRRDDGNVAAEAEHGLHRLSGVLAVEHGGDTVCGIANDRMAGLGGRSAELAFGVDEVARHAIIKRHATAEKRQTRNSYEILSRRTLALLATGL